jgi:predicted Zn-dependent peptidase
MEFKKKILDNGLSIVGEVNPAAKSAAVGFFVRTGSRDETTKINGVSHFLEHMVFKGTERLSAQQVNEAFDRTGAQFNAFTTEENTVYYAAVLPEYLGDVVGLWSELMRPSLRDSDFDIEKNVIKEEIAMYKDLPSYDVFDRGRSLYFDGHPCGHSVLGSNESIDALTSGQMREYFSSRYAPNNMVLACAGAFDWEAICALVEGECGNWQRKEAPRELTDWKGTGKKERAEAARLAREHICLISKGVAAQDDRRFAAAVLARIVGDDVGSRFFWELVDKALAESASMQSNSMDGVGAFYSYISCSREKAEKVMSVVRNVLDNLSKGGIEEEELRKAKNKILSELVIKNELPMGRLLDVGANWLYLGRYRSVEDDVAAIRAVTTDDVGRLIEELELGNFTQFSLGPSV